MILRLPLLGRILIWSLLNLLILGVAFGVFLWTELGGDSLLGKVAGDRSMAAANALTAELRDRPLPEWENALARFEEAYPVRVLLLREDGSRFLGARLEIPPELPSRLRQIAGPGSGPGPGPGPGSDDRRPGPPPGAFPEDRFDPGPLGNPGPPPSLAGLRPQTGGPRIFLRSGRPARYWLVHGNPIRGPGLPRGLRMAMVSQTLSAGGLFFDVHSWFWAASAVIAVSVLWWLPFVRGITRSVTRMTAATEQIAEGRFDTVVPDDRGDELGRLGGAINRMSGRLDGLVHGQKRFLGDVAHELCSPLARMEMALGILEQRTDGDTRSYVDDVREEVRHMSGLVNELLQFSKAALKPIDAAMGPVSLDELTRKVVAREWPEASGLSVDVPAGMRALGHAELVERAMGNLLRNARHHGGSRGGIRIESLVDASGSILWRVADSGPGVSEAELRRLGEPFYRPDRSRSSDTGGTGLGLAIVKSCMAACRGRLELANGPERGLVATLVLQPLDEGQTSGSPSIE
jgi:two-component system sensor histidine kinase CpxA